MCCKARLGLRFPFDMSYEDAQGELVHKTGMHYMLLPHEVVGTFYDFKQEDLLKRMIGEKGAPCLQNRMYFAVKGAHCKPLHAPKSSIASRNLQSSGSLR